MVVSAVLGFWRQSVYKITFPGQKWLEIPALITGIPNRAYTKNLVLHMYVLSNKEGTSASQPGLSPSL